MCISILFLFGASENPTQTLKNSEQVETIFKQLQQHSKYLFFKIYIYIILYMFRIINRNSFQKMTIL